MNETVVTNPGWQSCIGAASQCQPQGLAGPAMAKQLRQDLSLLHHPSRGPPTVDPEGLAGLLRARFGPGVRNALDYSTARSVLRTYGVARFLTELERTGHVQGGTITTGTEPFNVFARISAGIMKQPSMDAVNAQLSAPDRARFTFACNREVNDEHWESSDTEWVGRASMSEFHRFMLVNDPDWHGFNVLTLGIAGGAQLEAAVEMLRDMRRLAGQMAEAAGRTGPIGLYFHVYPYNSVQALHLHVVDLSRVGPTYGACECKNLPLDDVLSTLSDELEEDRRATRRASSRKKPQKRRRSRDCL